MTLMMEIATGATVETAIWIMCELENAGTLHVPIQQPVILQIPRHSSNGVMIMTITITHLTHSSRKAVIRGEQARTIMKNVGHSVKREKNPRLETARIEMDAKHVPPILSVYSVLIRVALVHREKNHRQVHQSVLLFHVAQILILQVMYVELVPQAHMYMKIESAWHVQLVHMEM